MKTIYTLLLFVLITTVTVAQNTISWDMGMNIAANTFGNLHPRITNDGNGNPVVIWGRSSDESVFISSWNGTAFTTPIKVNPSMLTVATANWMGPDIASKGDTVYVVMKQTPEADAASKCFIATSTDGGLSFSTPEQVDNIADSISRFPTVTVDANGNPIVGFMKFNSTFGDARWVVTKSNDLGINFSADVKASGWSAMGATVCDCCPGAITCNGNNVAMLYRDNNSNLRDIWCGVSTDGGNSFSNGMALDQNNWMLMSCPSSGPDGVIIGDTIYSTYMNGAGGNALVYFSKASISSMTNTSGSPITGTIAGLTQQNFPRMANSGNALAIIWKQVVSGNTQLLLRFAADITTGLPAAYDTVDTDNITNADVAMVNGKIFVVWEDDGSGTVKFRSGTYAVPNSIKIIPENATVTVYPNPAGDYFTLDAAKIPGYFGYSILDVTGKNILQSNYESLNISATIDVSNLADGTYLLQPSACYYRPAPIKFIIHRTK